MTMQNFAFLMDEKELWSLSPAYDITCIKWYELYTKIINYPKR